MEYKMRFEGHEDQCSTYVLSHFFDSFSFLKQSKIKNDNYIRMCKS